MKSRTQITDFGKIKKVLTADNYMVEKLFIKPKKQLKYDFHDTKLTIYIVVQGFVEVSYGYFKTWKGYGASFTPHKGEPYTISNNESTRAIILRMTVKDIKVPI